MQEVAVFFAGRAASLLFLEIVMHLFNPSANDIGTGRIQLFGTCIEFTQCCLIDTYANRFGFGVVRWRTPHLFGRHS
ncbi:hypothetical protein MA20_48185, partial [Bradyrhizobium japonicum]